MGILISGLWQALSITGSIILYIYTTSWLHSPHSLWRSTNRIWGPILGVFSPPCHTEEGHLGSDNDPSNAGGNRPSGPTIEKQRHGGGWEKVHTAKRPQKESEVSRRDVRSCINLFGTILTSPTLFKHVENFEKQEYTILLYLSKGNCLVCPYICWNVESSPSPYFGIWVLTTARWHEKQWHSQEDHRDHIRKRA